MSEASVDSASTGPGQPDWQDYAGKHVFVFALHGAYAFKRAPVLLRLAERAVEAITRLLKPPDVALGDDIPI